MSSAAEGMGLSAAARIAVALRSGVAHPAADLLRHALGLALCELGDLQARGILGARRQGRLARALELGERRRRLDLAQPVGLADERLALAPAQLAGAEEQEAEQRQGGCADLRV